MNHLSSVPRPIVHPNDEHQEAQLTIEKARSLVAEQGYLVKERQRLTLELRQILQISRCFKTQ